MTAAALLLLLLLLGRSAAAAIRVATTGLCRRRGRNRQSGDPRGEKQPGHRKFSFRTVKNGSFAAPFQQLNGWNLRSSALG
jgi:hypothetical protein